jgi:hypothetical protein
LRCKITHTDYSHHWYIRTRLQCGHIFMTRYAKSHKHRLQSSLIHQNNITMRPYLRDDICKITHTHIDLARRSSILLHVVIEQAPFCWCLRELISGFQWDHKAS